MLLKLEQARGLYVLRADVSAYGDSIPVHAHAPLWPLLDEHCARVVDAPTHEVLMRQVRRALTPPIEGIGTDGAAASQLVGLPTGSALLPVVENIYLDALDRDLSGIAGAFYARYGDDILFAHPEPEPRQRAEVMLMHHLGSLALSTNEKKMQRLYFTAAGRPCERDPACRAAQYVEYLGCRIAFDATVALTKKKWRLLLMHVRGLVKDTHALLVRQKLDQPTLTAAMCEMLAHAFDDTTPLAHPYVPIAMRVLTDRAQLRELDYAFALAVSERITGQRGVRAFRKLSYRELRRKYGLPSLVVARNARD